MVVETNRAIRRVLIVTYEFPPDGARGTKRMLKFLKYLPSCGWQPIVLTVRNPNYDFHDGSLLSELPEGLEVHRALTLESIVYAHRYRAHDVKDARAAKLAGENLGRFRKLFTSVYHALGRAFQFVDSRVLWLPFAVAKGVRLVKSRQIRVLFASGPSYTNQIAGMLLRILCKARLVIDFRDAWASDPARKAEKPWQRRIVRILERAVVSCADIVVSTTDGITRDFVSRYSASRDKFVTITNGYDPSDFQGLRGHSDGTASRPFVVLHAGTLGWERSPRDFLAATGSLVAKERDIASGMRVVFVGQNNRFNDGKSIEDYVREFGLEDIVELVGYVSRRDSLVMMADADLLLAVIGQVPSRESFVYGISHKLYDYAAVGREVMTIADEGASAEMAKRLGFQCIIALHDVVAIERCLCEYYREFRRQGYLAPHVNQEFLAQFDFQNLTLKLARILGDGTSIRPPCPFQLHRCRLPG